MRLVSFFAALLLYLLLLGAVLSFVPPKQQIKQDKERMQIDLTQLPAPKKPAESKKQQPKPKAAYDPKSKNDDTEGSSPQKPEKKPDKQPPKKQEGSTKPAQKPPVKKPAKKVRTKPAAKQPEKEAAPKTKPSQSGVIPISELNKAMQARAKEQEQQQQEAAQTKQEQRLKQLYGKEYGSLDSRAKQFLTTNIKSIQSITQRYLNELGYPAISIKTRQSGSNVVAFTLHPNGDISGLELIEGSGYGALDENSLELIEVAYKDYPLPDSKTPVRIKVIYSAF